MTIETRTCNETNPSVERITAWQAPASDDLGKFGVMLGKELGLDEISIKLCDGTSQEPKWKIMLGDQPLSQAYTKNEVVVAVAAFRAGFRSRNTG